MSSKFQKRLIGTIILIALGSIILPNFLDGKKKYYQDEFTTIPLTPKPSDRNKRYLMPPDDQTLSSQISNKSGTLVERFRQIDNVGQLAAIMQMKATIPTSVKLDPKLVEKLESKLISKAQATNLSNKLTIPKQVSKVQEWVVQLGALKNANKVLEIVANLRLSGYRVYTLPSFPIQGEITRIFIGPVESKEKLQSMMGELHRLSGLQGQLQPYSLH